MAAELAFDAEHITKSYGERRALDGVDLKIGRGEMVALIGPSGSGKSTLLRTLTGLVRIDKGGRVTTGGMLIQADGRLTDKVRMARTRTGFIFQQFNLVGRLTLFSNVMVGALGRIPGWRGALGFWPTEDKAKAMAALERVGIADRAAQRANTLSGGQQQRGAIARTLVQGAEAILADEPVASLDPVSARRVMATLEELNSKDGLTVIITLHHVEYALRYCRRIVALKAGKVVYDGPAKGLTRPLLVDIYGPEIEDVLGPEAVAELKEAGERA